MTSPSFMRQVREHLSGIERHATELRKLLDGHPAEAATLEASSGLPPIPREQFPDLPHYKITSSQKAAPPAEEEHEPGDVVADDPMPAMMPLGETPLVSIVIPLSGTPEYAERLDNCLAGVRSQRDYPADRIEVAVGLLVADEREDLEPLHEVCMKHSASLIVAKGEPGPFHLTKARNVGARQSNGDVFCFIDADIVLDPEAVRRTIPYLLLDRSSAVILTAYMPLPRGDAHNYRFDGDTDLFRRAVRRGDLNPHGYGGCMFMLREALERLRGYDEEYVGWGAEDADMAKRLDLAGFTVRNMTRYQNLRCLHQYHERRVSLEDKFTRANRERFRNEKTIERNPDGWGSLP